MENKKYNKQLSDISLGAEWNIPGDDTNIKMLQIEYYRIPHLFYVSEYSFSSIKYNQRVHIFRFYSAFFYIYIY